MYAAFAQIVIEKYMMASLLLTNGIKQLEGICYELLRTEKKNLSNLQKISLINQDDYS